MTSPAPGGFVNWLTHLVGMPLNKITVYPGLLRFIIKQRNEFITKEHVLIERDRSDFRNDY
jgi:hypothetical protein